MVRPTGVLLLCALAAACSRPRPAADVLSVCDLSRDFGAFRDKVIAVRGVYYYGLRENCPQRCAVGPWPSFINLTGTSTANTEWAALARVEDVVASEARKGKRLEIWVTVVGQLKTVARHSPAGPCDRIGSGYYGYGHLGAFPAELVVRQFRDIEVRENRYSPYDYGRMYRGPA